MRRRTPRPPRALRALGAPPATTARLKCDRVGVRLRRPPAAASHLTPIAKAFAPSPSLRARAHASRALSRASASALELVPAPLPLAIPLRGQEVLRPLDRPAALQSLVDTMPLRGRAANRPLDRIAALLAPELERWRCVARVVFAPGSSSSALESDRQLVVVADALAIEDCGDVIRDGHELLSNHLDFQERQSQRLLFARAFEVLAYNRGKDAHPHEVGSVDVLVELDAVIQLHEVGSIAGIGKPSTDRLGVKMRHNLVSQYSKHFPERWSSELPHEPLEARLEHGLVPNGAEQPGSAIP